MSIARDLLDFIAKLMILKVFIKSWNKCYRTWRVLPNFKLKAPPYFFVNYIYTAIISLLPLHLQFPLSHHIFFLLLLSSSLLVRPRNCLLLLLLLFPIMSRSPKKNAWRVLDFNCWGPSTTRFWWHEIKSFSAHSSSFVHEVQSFM